MIEYTLIRSRRKTVVIHITKEAVVEVRAPLKMPKIEIDRFVNSKETWIEKHLSKREQLNEMKSVFTLNYGGTALLRGCPYPVRAKDGNRIGFNSEGFYIPLGLPPDDIKRAVIQIYKMEAKRTLKEKVGEYSELMGVVPAAARITSAKTRWGSCSGKNSINFSWRLIMADDGVIDYVVVHELAHIKEHNHLPRFWAVVEKAMPDYRTRQKRLKLLQKELAAQDWD